MTTDGLSQLASSGLPSLGGSYENPSWKRSLGELKASGDSLWTQNSAARNNASNAYGSPAATPTSAFGLTSTTVGTPLLGTKRLPDLGQTAPSTENASFQSTQRAETNFLQWEEANRRREVDILSNIVQNAEMTTRKRSQDLFEKKMEEDWENTLDLWAQEVVGSRTLGGSARSEQHGLSTSNSTGAVPLITGGGGGGVDQPALMNYNSMSIPDRRVDPRIVQSHADIFKQLKQKSSKPNLQDLATAANELRLLADSLGQDSPGSTCYASALQIVSGILSRPNASPLEIALATLGYFSKQFEDYMIGRVRSAGMDGQSGVGQSATYKNTNASTIAAFVSIEGGGSVEGSLWPILFYCLRVGDAVAAKEAFDVNANPDEIDDTNAAIATLLSSLAQRQGSHDSIWKAPGPLTLPSDEVRKVAEACEMAKAAERQDMRRLSFLSLLSGAGAFQASTIEDYLFGLLWKAMQSPNPVVELENLGKEIRKLGSSYFGDEVSGGWSYSLPLFASQQYRTGLTYLVEAGGAMGLMQATHLGVLLSSCGVNVDNLGDSGAQTASGGLETSLLVQYSDFLHFDFGAVCALEYLLWIPNEHVVMTELVSLLLKTKNFLQLTGELSGDGKRQKGVLDNYFAAQDISMILKQTAERCLTNANDRNRQTTAGVLFMLSGDYKSVIALMSRLMAPDTKTNTQDVEKQHWYNQSRQFDSMYLSKSTPVAEALQHSNGQHVVDTFRALMQLFDFLDLMSKGRSAEAWSILNCLQILPTNQSDIANKDVVFQGLDPLLQNAMPAVLMAAMQSLYQEHGQLKRDMHSARSATMSALSERKNRARVLLSFAGIISNIPMQPTIEAMSRLEANMN